MPPYALWDEEQLELCFGLDEHVLLMYDNNL